MSILFDVRLQRIVVAAGAASLLFILAFAAAMAQGLDDREALRAQLKALHDSGQATKAEERAKQVVAMAEEKLGAEHPDVAQWIDILAEMRRTTGDAEGLYRRSLAIRVKAFGASHLEVARSLRNLALLYSMRGRQTEALDHQLRCIAIYEANLGPNHPELAAILNEAASMYEHQARNAEALPLRQRSLAIYEQAPESDPVAHATALNDLAVTHHYSKRYGEAEALHKRALAIYEQALGHDHYNVATSLNNLAETYRAQGVFADAEPLYRRALAVHGAAPRRANGSIQTTLNNLAELYEQHGRQVEAEATLAERNRIRAALLDSKASDRVTVTKTITNLSYPRQVGGLYSAADHMFTGDLHGRAASVLAYGNDAVNAIGGSSARRSAEQFVRSVWDLTPTRYGRDESKVLESFWTAQWAFASEAADSLALMAARGGTANAALGPLVRERQDLRAEWQLLRKQPDAAQSRLSIIEVRLKEINDLLDREFPQYANLIRPKPLTVAETQGLLGVNEALILALVTPQADRREEETFIWVVTRGASRWVRTNLGTKALTREVAALRCGLDAALWDEEATSDHCGQLVNGKPRRDRFGNILNETLPFDSARAHALYKALFGEVEGLIQGKHLLIAPTGPLTQLPFHVLVTSHASGSDERATVWLARGHAITVLPAVVSLKALRQVNKPSTGDKPMLGIGNPLLDGSPAVVPVHARWAALARAKQTCQSLQPLQVADATRKGRGVLRVPTHRGRADLDHLRAQSPLHDTADELCTVAADLKLATADVLLGARATETALKEMSGEGRLARYRVLHFATHGAIAGEIEGTSEPGLILTPPKEASDTDDGYLSASEVASLKLDADWVILSACNTAAGGAQGAEALSGLARSFIYAGARALLVSHWAVDSAATVKLITSAVGTITRDKTVGRAEALRQAMLDMIDRGEAREAHPAFWAPFVVVGEGAAAR